MSGSNHQNTDNVSFSAMSIPSYPNKLPKKAFQNNCNCFNLRSSPSSQSLRRVPSMNNIKDTSIIGILGLSLELINESLDDAD